MFSRLFWIATPFVYWLALLTGTVHSLDTLFPAALRSQLKIGTKSLNESCEISPRHFSLAKTRWCGRRLCEEWSGDGMTWRSATTMTLDCFTAVRKDDRERSIFIEPPSSDEIRGETKIFEEMYLMYIDDEIFVSTKKIADDTDSIRSCWSCCR